MSKQYKIAVAGIGGVGGFYGGLLANTYENSLKVSVNFAARGKHMQAIKQRGLKLERNTGSIVAHPYHITDNPKELGKLDLILFCCKAYDLEQLALSFVDNITEQTILLPLLNGIDHTETLQRVIPNARAIYGCTYLVSKVVADGIVSMTGDLNQLLFGSPDVDTYDLEAIRSIFAATGANVVLANDIKLKLWEKFSFISPLATATSAMDSTVDVILNDADKKAVLHGLMAEVVMLSRLEGVHLPDDVVEINMAKVAKLPAGATSSMHNDFRNGKRTELEQLTGYVVKQGHQHGLDVPVYSEQYMMLKGRVVQTS